MRTLVLALLAIALIPAAAASKELPVGVNPHAEVTTPSDDCPDCVGVSAGAGVFLNGCMDCPAFGVGAGASHGDGQTTVEARACYSSLFYFCLVDEEVTV